MINKTRYAVLGVLLEGPASGYEIKSMMQRSTAYFWRESDSTIYPMLKRLASEGAVCSEANYVGKKRREIYSITDPGRSEFAHWLEGPTTSETPRNEFLLKLFFASDPTQAQRLFQERLEKSVGQYEQYEEIEKRLEEAEDSPRRAIRLKSLRYGMAQLALEIEWLSKEIS